MRSEKWISLIIWPHGTHRRRRLCCHSRRPLLPDPLRRSKFCSRRDLSSNVCKQVSFETSSEIHWSGSGRYNLLSSSSATYFCEIQWTLNAPRRCSLRCRGSPPCNQTSIRCGFPLKVAKKNYNIGYEMRSLGADVPNRFEFVKIRRIREGNGNFYGQRNVFFLHEI